MLRDKSPGQQECDAAIDTINKAIADLDRASMAALTRSLPTNTASSLNEFHGEMRQELEELKAVLRPLSTAATEEAENLGHRVTAFASVVPRLSTCAIGAASRTKGQQQQTTLLEQTKTVAESAGQMAFACKSAGGNPKVRNCTGYRKGEGEWETTVCAYVVRYAVFRAWQGC